MRTTVWWIRRDLRLVDNQALQAAVEAAEQVIPLFILDPFFEKSSYVADKRLAFLYNGLRALDAALKQKGSRLIIRQGKPIKVLTQLIKETGAESIFAEADYSSYARQRDETINSELPLTLSEGVVVHHPNSLLKSDDTPYQVFTPFKKNAWLVRPLPHSSQLLPAPERINTPHKLGSLQIPDSVKLPDSVPFKPGETEARKRLATFTESSAIYDYGANRNQLDLNGTSGLSPYLRFGMISARQTAVAAIQAREAANTDAAKKAANTFLGELIWREFYYSILYHFPHVVSGSFRPEYDNIDWRNDPDEFTAWQQGETGYPVVDAAMHQLKHTGWMHSRARMIVASFLVKDLLIDWRWGERYFMQQLVDGDPANNNGGWQWTAGTGTDAAPYFRIFNPVTQSKKFDPNGEYSRRWLPQLKRLPAKSIHTPWKLSAETQEHLDFKIGRDYPAPIVDHKEARSRTLAAYEAAREENS